MKRTIHERRKYKEKRKSKLTPFTVTNGSRITDTCLRLQNKKPSKTPGRCKKRKKKEEKKKKKRAK